MSFRGIQKIKKRMKKSFDLTAIAEKGSTAFVARIAGSGILLSVALWLLLKNAFAYGILCGVLAGAIDLSILFLGIKKALPYVEEPKQGLKVMKRFRWCRVAAAAAFIITMLKMKLAVHGAFCGFLLIHILFILNLLFIAYQHQNERA